MYTDLHMHTIYSDGEFAPLDVVTMARERKVSVAAITDHNNIEGSKIAVANNPYKDITIIPGVEFTAKSPASMNIHILGLNIDLNNKALNNLTNAYTEDSKNRIKSNLKVLKERYSMTFAEEDVKKMLSAIGNIGRPEIAKLCLEYGYVSSINEAFEKYLNPVKSLVARKEVDPTDKELIRYILDAGGIPCLAHPQSLKMTLYDVREYIKDLKNVGLMAIEAYHSDCNRDYTVKLLNIANDLGLYVSVGSDFHGPIVSPKVHIRSGRNGNLNLKEVSILELFTEVKTYDKKS